jgi:hypothetical protein
MYARTAGPFSVSERVADFCRMMCSVHPSISTLVAAFQFQILSIQLALIATAMRVQPEKGTVWPNLRRLAAVWAVRLTQSINYQALALSLRRGLFLFSAQAVHCRYRRQIVSCH